MTINRERFASRQLKRFSRSFDDQTKESFIDITVASSSCDSNDDDSNSSDISSRSRKSNNLKDNIERFDQNDLVMDGLLGTGGFSNVYQMHHRKTGRVFAVKTLRNSIRQNEKKLSVCAGELAVETAILAKLNHENIIKLHGIRGDGNVVDHLNYGTFFLCIESLQGGTLYDKMVQWREEQAKRKKQHRFLPGGGGRRMKEESTIMNHLENIAVGIVKGMEYLHSKNIIYRDLKPGNIGFDEKTQQIKLFDFGLARVVSDDTTDESGNQTRLMTRKVGTPRYMAPEIIRGITNYSFGVDVYSFSILLWQLVTNRIAFDYIQSPSELKRAVSIGKVRPPIECVPKIHLVLSEKKPKNKTSKKLAVVESEWLRDLIEASWSDSPKNRPTFKEIRQELEFIIESSSSAVNNNRKISKRKRRRRTGSFFCKFSSSR